MDVLDDQQPRPPGAGALDHFGDRLAAAAQAGRVVHRIEYEQERRGLLHVKQIVDEYFVLRGKQAVFQRALDARPADGFVGGSRHLE